MRPGPAGRRLFVLAGAAFTVSGATSLAFQVVWSKALGQVLGNSYSAIATVVAAFLCGLSLGAWLGGRSGLLLRRPLLSYGLLEVGVGVFGLCSLPLVRGLEPVLELVAARVDPASGAFTLIRFAATFLLLLPPTLMMGASLPVLVHWAAGGTDRLAGALSRLYALNTAGAVLGTLAAGFVLVQRLGLIRTALAAGATNILLGCAVAFAGRRLADSESPTEPDAEPASGRAGPRPPAARGALGADSVSGFARNSLVLCLVAVSGAVALTLEMGWTRLAGLLFGSSVYSFSLVLAAFLLGIALGAALVSRWADRSTCPWRLFAVLQWGVAAGALWASVRIAQVPWEFAAQMAGSARRPGALWLRESLLLMGFVLPATLALGALFPVSARLLARTGERPGGVTGRLYLANTLGTVLGSLAAGLWLIPLAGVRATLLGAVVVAGALGIVAWWAAPETRTRARDSGHTSGSALGRYLAPAIAAGALALCVPLLAPWDRNLLAAGMFRPVVAGPGLTLTPQQARAQLARKLETLEIIFYREGRSGLVTVHRARNEPNLLALRVNGKTDASTGRDMETEILLGLLPMVWAPEAARVCVIGQGAGVTLGSVLRHEPSRVDLVEIEPAVLEASRLFDRWNDSCLDDPRVRVHIDDARSFLRYRPQTYDVIVSEPSNPWLAGVNNLFTEEYYRLVAARLNPGGVLCQWVQFYEISPSTLSSILQALHHVFPYGQVFHKEADLLIVASVSPLRLDLDRVRERLSRARVADDLARARVYSWGGLLSLRIADLHRISTGLPRAPTNTDDRPFVEYQAPRDLYEVEPGRIPVNLDALMPPDLLADLPEWLVTDDPRGTAAALAEGCSSRGDPARAARFSAAVGKSGASNNTPQ